ncbi:HD domain-containing protein [Patescibacteria group bacterium]|nr:HD domain-containing protein [Patescibacteria group bacterium]
MLNFRQIKNHPQVLEFIKQSELSIKALDYTEHGLRHANLVAQEAQKLAKKIGLSKQGQELVAIAGFCHDMGNFLGRTQHHYWGALLFHQVFQNDFSPRELTWITQAIVNHDKYTMKLTSPISAIVVLADKSDVHRERVASRSMEKIKADIHDRVNYAVTRSDLKIDKVKKQIILILKIDRKFVPIMEYFEIFTDRMAYCRRAANYLGYKFSLVINNFKLL